MAEPWAACEKCHQDGRRSVPSNMLTAPAFLNAEQVAWGEKWPDSELEGGMHVPSACWAQPSEPHELQESSMIPTRNACVS